MSPPDYIERPPKYMFADTCALCWEHYFDDSLISRWLHKRLWGHTPINQYPKPTRQEEHEQLVEKAERYRRMMGDM